LQGRQSLDERARQIQQFVGLAPQIRGPLFIESCFSAVAASLLA
jgi:hypothetical protein